ncbi:hypothetical protein [Acinetobacter baumannii]|uniref:hypothetical protein n=1 Tax=Acinetobacter baumannii TaxID=470 RepID=UPI001112BF67|nr:hypothetical protein [Acinetobacter baumannii]
MSSSQEWKFNTHRERYFTLANNKHVGLSTQYACQSAVEYRLDQNHITFQVAYGRCNGRIVLADTASYWRLAWNVRNITDQSYATLLSTNGSRITHQVPRDDER